MKREKRKKGRGRDEVMKGAAVVLSMTTRIRKEDERETDGRGEGTV